MSKKLYSTAKWKRYLKSRQEYQLRQQRAARRTRRITLPKKDKRLRRRFLTLHVPPVFSILKNPEITVGFLNQMEFAAKRYNLDLDLSGVTDLSSDAVAALIATIQRLKEHAVIQGRAPTEQMPRDMLFHSGFFDYVHSQQKLPESTLGRISKKQSQIVEPLVARDLVHFGTQVIHGQPKRSSGVSDTHRMHGEHA